MVIPCLLPMNDLGTSMCPKSGQGDMTGMLLETFEKGSWLKKKQTEKDTRKGGLFFWWIFSNT